jgi:hypothetical protein
MLGSLVECRRGMWEWTGDRRHEVRRWSAERPTPGGDYPTETAPSGGLPRLRPLGVVGDGMVSTDIVLSGHSDGRIV